MGWAPTTWAKMGRPRRSATGRGPFTRGMAISTSAVGTADDPVPTATRPYPHPGARQSRAARWPQYPGNGWPSSRPPPWPRPPGSGECAASLGGELERVIIARTGDVSGWPSGLGESCLPPLRACALLRARAGASLAAAGRQVLSNEVPENRGDVPAEWGSLLRS